MSQLVPFYPKPVPVFLPGEPQGRGSLWAAVYEVAKSWTRLIDLTLTFHFHGEGNGNPLQCSCLENPQGQGRLVGCHLWGRTESDTTEAT